MSKKIKVAIIGATGLIGRKIIQVLSEENLDVDLKLYASSKSRGIKIDVKNQHYDVLTLNSDSFINVDYAIFAAGKEVAEKFVPVAIEAGAKVIDNSSFYRFHEQVPLIVPEVNFSAYQNEPLIANPNCSTIQAVIPLKLVDNLFNVKKVIYSTYQAVSGSGVNGLIALEEDSNFYGKRIVNNCVPKIDKIMDSNYTFEEYKMIHETRKILDKAISVSATCVRVPVTFSHCVSVSAFCDEVVDVNQFIDSINQSTSLRYEEVPINDETTNKNITLVGRIRKDLYDPKLLHFYCVADNTLRGAAYNSVLILKALLKTGEKNV